MHRFRAPASVLILSLLALLPAVEAHATPTPISISPTEPDLIGDWNGVPPGAPDHEGLLAYLYGWDNLTRVEDVHPLLDDRWWSSAGGGEAILRASFAGNLFTFGVLDGSGFSPVLSHGTERGYFDGLAAPFASPDAAHRFALRGALTGTFFDSAQAPDHMVTFQITGNGSQYGRDYSANLIGSFVVGWEDLPLAMSDRDYNDLVLELRGVQPAREPTAPIPEPASALLMGSGLAAMWIARRRRQRRETRLA